MKHKASISHDEVMRKKLKNDPEFAMEYLKAAMEDTEEPQVLLIALRRIAEARGGLAKVAKAAGIQRESLYRALYMRGNQAPFHFACGDQSHRPYVDRQGGMTGCDALRLLIGANREVGLRVGMAVILVRRRGRLRGGFVSWGLAYAGFYVGVFVDGYFELG